MKCYITLRLVTGHNEEVIFNLFYYKYLINVPIMAIWLKPHYPKTIPLSVIFYFNVLQRLSMSKVP